MFKRIIIPVLAALAVAMAFTACEPENNVTPYEWDVTARLAKHSDGETADHGNWEAVGSVEISGNVISIEADESRMEEYLSTDPEQQDKAHKWFAILIGTGEDDIKKVTYNGNPLTEKDVSERNDMLGKDGSAAASDEFVLWLTTENANGYRFILGHENAESLPVSIIYRNTAEPEAEELPEASVALVNDIMKAAFASFDTLETGTEAFTSGSYEGTADLTVTESSWTLHVTADIEGTKDAAAGHDVEFTVTSDDVEEGNDILVTIAGMEYKASAEAISSGVEMPERPVEEFEWDIYFYGAKHSRGASEDHDNWKQVTAYIWDDKDLDLQINANVGYMESFRSSNPDQGTAKWFPVLIATGENDITKVRYNGEYLTAADIADRDDMIKLDFNSLEMEKMPSDDEFVLWLDAEDVLANGKTITLSHEGAEDAVIDISINDVTPEDMTAEDKSALQDYIFGFGHDKTIQDLNSILRGLSIDGIAKPYGIISGSDSIQLTLELDGYDYDGTHGDRTITGTVNYEFYGDMDEPGLFQATEYAYWTGNEGITFAGGNKEVTAVISADDPVTGRFSSKSIGGIELKLTFVMDGDDPAGIVSEDLQVVKLQAPVSGSISTPESAPADIADILGDISIYENKVAGADADDLYGMIEYAGLAQKRNREKLWWAGTNQTLDGWTSADAVYDAEAGTMTFDITLTDYDYSTNGKTVSGSMQLVFHGVEDTADGKPVLNATLWQIVSDGELVFEGGSGSLTVSDVDLTGPIVKGKTIDGTPAVITFLLNGNMWDRNSEFPGDFTSYIAKYLPDQYIGFSDLTGGCEYGGNRISGEMFNHLLDTYGGLIG